jgi:tetratricopeptide (TPR) repeat protein
MTDDGPVLEEVERLVKEDPLAAAEALEEVGERAFSRHDLAGAEEAFERAAMLASEGGDQAEDLAADCFSQLGTIRLYKGDIDGAREAYSAARTHFESIGDRRGLANVLGALGDVETRASHLDGALEHYELSLSILEEIGDKRGQAYALKALGTLHTHREEVDEARDALLGALERFRDAWDRVGEGNTYQALGNLVAGEPELATTYYREALGSHAIASDLRGMAGDFGYLGRAAMRAGRYGEAAMLHERSLALHLRVGAHQEAIYNLIDQSKAFLRLEGQTAAALACLKLGADAGETLESLDASDVAEHSKTILEQVAAHDPDVAERLAKALDADASSLKTQGILSLLADPTVAVLFFDDMMMTAEVLEDYDQFIDGLLGQARAMQRVDQFDGASAALELAEQAVENMPQHMRSATTKKIAALRDVLGLTTTTQAENAAEDDDAEARRARAVEALRTSEA